MRAARQAMKISINLELDDREFYALKRVGDRIMSLGGIDRMEITNFEGHSVTVDSEDDFMETGTIFSLVDAITSMVE